MLPSLSVRQMRGGAISSLARKRASASTSFLIRDILSITAPTSTTTSSSSLSSTSSASTASKSSHESSITYTCDLYGSECPGSELIRRYNNLTTSSGIGSDICGLPGYSCHCCPAWPTQPSSNLFGLGLPRAQRYGIINGYEGMHFSLPPAGSAADYHPDPGGGGGGDTGTCFTVPIPLPIYIRARPSPSHHMDDTLPYSLNGGSRSLQGRRCRRSRTVFSELQLMGLERRFDKQKYLSTPDRLELAESLALNQVQVKTWYQNRRMKWKKQVLSSGCTEAPTKPKGRPKKNSIPSASELDLLIDSPINYEANVIENIHIQQSIPNKHWPEKERPGSNVDISTEGEFEVDRHSRHGRMASDHHRSC